MINLSRRFFLGGAVATAAAAYLPARSFHPVLFGDGVHDDTAALQALFDGGDVTFARSGVAAIKPGEVALGRGTFSLSDTIKLRQNGVRRLLSGCVFQACGDGWGEGKAMFDIELPAVADLQDGVWLIEPGPIGMRPGETRAVQYSFLAGA